MNIQQRTGMPDSNVTVGICSANKCILSQLYVFKTGILSLRFMSSANALCLY